MKLEGFAGSEINEVDAIKATAAGIKEIGGMGDAVNMTVGVFHRPGSTRMEDWYNEAQQKAAFSGKEGKKTGYDFLGDPEFVEMTKKLVFGDDTDNVDVVPSYGGSEAISLGTGATKPIVPIGVPTWPNHAGLIQRSGGIFIPYPHLDDKGKFNNEAFVRMMTPKGVQDYVRTSLSESAQLRIVCQQLGLNEKDLSSDEKNRVRGMLNLQLDQKSISPLVEGAGKNPLAIGIPRDQHESFVSSILSSGNTLQIDFAYLGFVNGIEEDLELVRLLKKKGVKILIYFSYSKFHQYFSDERVGAVLAVNFEPEEKMKERLLDQTRNTTSAKAGHGQRMAVEIETNDDIRAAQRSSVNTIRHHGNTNRTALAAALSSDASHFGSGEAAGPFLFSPDQNNIPALSLLHPELARALGYPMASNYNLPSNFRPIAAVQTSAACGGGFGGVRLSIADTPIEDIQDALATMKYARDFTGSL